MIQKTLQLFGNISRKNTNTQENIPQDALPSVSTTSVVQTKEKKSTVLSRFFSSYSKKNENIVRKSPITARVCSIDSEKIKHLRTLIQQMEKSPQHISSEDTQKIKELFTMDKLSPLGAKNGVGYFTAKKDGKKSNFIINPLNNALVYWDTPVTVSFKEKLGKGAFKDFTIVKHDYKNLPILCSLPSKYNPNIQGLSNAVIEATINKERGAELLVVPQELWKSTNSNTQYVSSALGEENLYLFRVRQPEENPLPMATIKEYFRDILLANEALSKLGYMNFDVKEGNLVFHEQKGKERVLTIDIEELDLDKNAFNPTYTNQRLFENLYSVTKEDKTRFERIQDIYPLFSSLNLYQQLLSIIPQKSYVNILLTCAPIACEYILAFVAAQSPLKFLKKLETLCNPQDEDAMKSLNYLRYIYIFHKRKAQEERGSFTRFDSLLARYSSLPAIHSSLLDIIKKNTSLLLEASNLDPNSNECYDEYDDLTTEEKEELSLSATEMDPLKNNLLDYYKKTFLKEENREILVQDAVEKLGIDINNEDHIQFIRIAQHILLLPNTLSILVTPTNPIEKVMKDFSESIYNFLHDFAETEKYTPAKVSTIYSYIPVVETTAGESILTKDNEEKDTTKDTEEKNKKPINDKTIQDTPLSKIPHAEHPPVQEEKHMPPSTQPQEHGATPVVRRKQPRSKPLQKRPVKENIIVSPPHPVDTESVSFKKPLTRDEYQPLYRSYLSTQKSTAPMGLQKQVVQGKIILKKPLPPTRPIPYKQTSPTMLPKISLPLWGTQSAAQEHLPPTTQKFVEKRIPLIKASPEPMLGRYQVQRPHPPKKPEGLAHGFKVVRHNGK